MQQQQQQTDYHKEPRVSTRGIKQNVRAAFSEEKALSQLGTTAANE